MARQIGGSATAQAQQRVSGQLGCYAMYGGGCMRGWWMAKARSPGDSGGGAAALLRACSIIVLTAGSREDKNSETQGSCTQDA
jgi:hypothetical protein